MTLKTKISSLISCLDQKNRLTIFFLIGFMVVGFSQIKTQSIRPESDRFQIDTIIPSGYVLIPIKLLNADAISSVIGSHGVADIYATVQGERTKLLFSRAKIIKSPVEESTFSVLVKETKAQLLSNSQNPFFAAVQNPRTRAIESESEVHRKPGVKIIYQN